MTTFKLKASRMNIGGESAVMRTVRQTVDRLRDKYLTSDPRELCGHLGIVVLDCDLPMQMHGFYQHYLDTDLVYLNSRMPERVRRVTCAHELGHALLHPGINTLFVRSNTHFVVGRYEREADFFALYLLADRARRLNGGIRLDFRDPELIEQMPDILDALRRDAALPD